MDLAPGAYPGLNWPWQRRRDKFRERLRQNPPAEVSPEELEAHFSGMPARYWRQLQEADLFWGLAAVHGFLKLVTGSSASATKPYMDWRRQPSEQTRVMICTWDRQGLLAKAAAAFSELRLSILTAEAFTRADNLVLDTFCVMDLQNGGAASDKRLKEMLFLLEGALSEPPRFASVWMCSRHHYLARPAEPGVRIRFDNQSSAISTVLRVEAADRLGLLYDILHALDEEGINVSEAQILTENQQARDTLYLTDAAGAKLRGPERLRELRLKLAQALSPKPS